MKIEKKTKKTTNQMRDSFIFYRSFYEGIKELPRDVQGEVLTAIMEYSLDGVTTIQLKPIAKAMFILIKPQIDANTKRYENGKKGGRPSDKNNQNETEQKPKQNQNETKPKPNVNDNDNVNDNVLKKEIIKEKNNFKNENFDLLENDEKEKEKKVAPKKEKDIPDYNVFENYALEHEPSLDKNALYNKYKSWVANDWKDGYNKPILNWKSKILNNLSFIPKIKIDGTNGTLRNR